MSKSAYVVWGIFRKNSIKTIMLTLHSVVWLNLWLWGLELCQNGLEGLLFWFAVQEKKEEEEKGENGANIGYNTFKFVDGICNEKYCRSMMTFHLNDGIFCYF